MHGHIRNLAEKGVDRIFMPVITTVPSENTEETSQSMCAVVKGYPLVIRNSDNPAQHLGVPYDAPMFHWYTEEDKKKQLVRYMSDTWQIPQQIYGKSSDGRRKGPEGIPYGAAEGRRVRAPAGGKGKEIRSCAGFKTLSE